MSENNDHTTGGTFADGDVIDSDAGNSKSFTIQGTEPIKLIDGQAWTNSSIDPPYIQYYDTTNTDWEPVRTITYEAVAANTFPTNVEDGPNTNGNIVIAYTDAADTYMWIRANGKYFTIKSA